MIDCIIEHNDCDWTIGGLDFSNCTVDLTNCLIVYNWAQYNGGAMGATSSCVITMSNCTVAHNSVTDSYPGGIYLYSGSDLTMTDCVLYHNTSGGGNADLNAGGGTPPATATLSYTCYDPAEVGNIGGGTVNFGSGNQTGTPNFLTGPLGDHYLDQSTSPCVDAGSQSAANAGVADKTTNTTHALDTGTVDMGFHYSP
jgi:parallel beta-helix repeat protein